MIDQDLVLRVGPQNLCRKSCWFNDTLEDNNNLQMIHRTQLCGVELIERTTLLDSMSNAYWHDKDNSIRPILVSTVQVALLELVALVYRVYQLVPVELQAHVSLDHLGLAYVSDSHLEILMAIFFVDDGLLAEHDGLSAMSRPSDFGKY